MMPKVTWKSGGDKEDEEEKTFHGVVNEEEAWLHMQVLDTIIKDMASKIEERSPEAVKKAIRNFKEAITTVMLGMEEANSMTVLKAVRDPSCLALYPYMEEVEENLEELMPVAEIPSGESMAAEIVEIEPLDDKQKAQIGELFKDMEAMHGHLTHSCSLLGILSR